MPGVTSSSFLRWWTDCGGHKSCSAGTESRTTGRYSRLNTLGFTPMYATRLRPLLAKDTFGPDRVSEISDICDEWYKTEASLPSFVFRSIFRDLITDDWNDEQGVPTPVYERFRDDVLLRLNAVLDALP